MLRYHSVFMGRTRLPSFCLSRFATRIRARSPAVELKPISPKAEDQKAPKKQSGNVEMDSGTRGGQLGEALGRRIMIVVDSSSEAKAALQWALSHSVQNHDRIVLLDIAKPSKNGDHSRKEMDPRCYELLYAMKKICQNKRPEVQVELCLVEGKDRGLAIVEEARKQGVSLLVLGQKKHFITWRLLMMWAGNRVGGGVVEYCIQNASCMTLAVRKNSRRAGGYLITTRRHKDFWLLA